MKKIASILTMLTLTLVMAISLFTLEAKAYSQPIDYTRAVYYVDTFEELKAACEATRYDRTIIFEKDITVGYDDFVSAGSSDNYMEDYQITIKGDTAVLIDLNGWNYSVLSRNTNFVFAVRESATVHFINSHPSVLSSIKFDVNNDPVHGVVGINHENKTALVNVNTEGGFYSDNVSYLLGEFDLSEQAGDNTYITNNDKRVTNIFLQNAKEAVMTRGTVNNVYSGGRGININSASSSTPDFKVELTNIVVKAGEYAINSKCSKSLTVNHNVTLQSYVPGGQCMFTLSTGDTANVATILGKDKLDNKAVVYSTDKSTVASSETKLDNLGARAYFIYEGNAMPDLSSYQQDASMILPQGHVIRFSYSGMWNYLEEHSYELDEDGYAYCRCGHEAKYEVILEQKSYEYDGTAKKPAVILKVGAVEVNPYFYTVEYENNTDIGTATVIIEADESIGLLKGTASATFKITPKVVNPTVVLSGTSFTYNGKVQKPTVTVKNGNDVIPATDYTVEYPSGMINPGTYTVTVNLKGKYQGTGSATFTINPAKQVVDTPVADTPEEITPVIELNKTSYVYNGKVQKPTVTVKNGNGVIPATDYTVTYSKGCKNVGRYTVSVTLTGKYKGTASKSFDIIPKNIKLKKLTAGKKKLTVTWNKLTKQTTGYEIQYSTSSKFKNAMKVTVKKNKTTKTVIKKLKSKKKYYVRIRTYKTVKVNGKSTKLYSGWSAYKYAKVK